MSVLALGPVAALALSFAAFVVSGGLGWPAYRASGDLPLRETGWLALGSLIGAILGVLVGLALPAQVLTVVLYLVVLASGTTVLVRMRPSRKMTPERAVRDSASTSQRSVAVYVAVGFATAVICAATGAGGPVLVVPILMLLGFSARSAVGMALLDSVAIAVPSAIGYFAGGAIDASVWALLPFALVGHAAGTVAGSMNAHRINATVLKAIVAVGSVGVALFKLAGLLLG